MDQNNRKKTVVITGGGSGIGLAIAERFTNSGQVNIVLIGRSEDKLKQAKKQLGDHVLYQRADISVRDDVEKVAKKITDHYEKVDVLINAAGSVRGVSTKHTLAEAEQHWDENMNNNLKGSFLMTLALAPYITRPGGRIIHISSIAAFTGGSRPGAMSYAAAKSGLFGLTFGLARELSSEGITVNSIAPGFIEKTGFTGHWPQERIDEIVKQVPAGRAGQVEDIAATAYFLASPEAAYITGEIVNVNGGWLFGR